MAEQSSFTSKPLYWYFDMWVLLFWNTIIGIKADLSLILYPNWLSSSLRVNLIIMEQTCMVVTICHENISLCIYFVALKFPHHNGANMHGRDNMSWKYLTQHLIYDLKYCTTQIIFHVKLEIFVGKQYIHSGENYRQMKRNLAQGWIPKSAKESTRFPLQK